MEFLRKKHQDWPSTSIKFNIELPKLVENSLSYRLNAHFPTAQFRSVPFRLEGF